LPNKVIIPKNPILNHKSQKAKALRDLSLR
jgi:hypothetical protein